jgi:acetylornithine deacetylase/succinyl-diaminopimelate desuccinylase-like protein
MRPRDEPSVIAAAADLVARLGRLDEQLRSKTHPLCGPASVFIGQVHAGEIFNQYPQEAWLEGTRRWLPGTHPAAAEREFRTILAQLAEDSGTKADLRWMLIRDSFSLDPADPFVAAFQRCHRAISGAPLPSGPKPFVDDGNSFSALGGVPAITHGPRASGQHTVSEWVEIDDLVRVAWLYAATAVEFCSVSHG